MTQEEYDKTGWTAHMKAIYKGVTYDVAACHFPEYLVALCDEGDDDPDDYMWVRCENIEIVKN